MVALEALSEICEDFGDELVNGPARTFPQVDLSVTACDEDMPSIHMTMIGEPYGEQGDQRGCPK